MAAQIFAQEEEIQVLEEQLKDQETQLEAKAAVFETENNKQIELEARCKEIEAQMKAKMEAAEAIKVKDKGHDNSGF